MKIILGGTSKKEFVEVIKGNGWGRMLTPQRRFKIFDMEPYAIDNGAFYCWRNGSNFDEVAFLKTIDFSLTLHKPYLAILPDIVAGGNKSLDFSMSWIDRLPDYNWYLAVQDGMDSARVVDCIDMVSGLFLGGSDRFKRTGPYWCKLAHHNFKLFHYGRAGTYSKLQHAYQCGADSLDSAFPLWTKQRFKEFQTWVELIP